MQYNKTGLLYFSVLTFELYGKIILKLFSQQNALVQKFLLHNGQSNHGFWGIDIVLRISLLIIVLQIDYGVFLFGHLKILSIGMQSQHISFCPVGIRVMGIAMDGYK